MRRLTAALGPAEGTPEPDQYGCALEPQVDHQWQNLRVHIRDGKFVAWTIGAATEGGPEAEDAYDFHTPEGLGTGDYVAAVRQAYPAVEIDPGADILGHFTVRPAPGQARQLWGYLTGTADTDLVDMIFAGDCGPDPSI